MPPQDYIAQDNPEARSVLPKDIADAARTLLKRPPSGRAIVIAAGTREWVVSGTPYLLEYRVSSSTLEILRV